MGVWEWITSSAAANLGQFFGSILTALSVLLALYIILRDQRRNARTQADQVSAWIVGNGFERLVVTNNSSARIVHPRVYLETRPRNVWMKQLNRETITAFKEELLELAPKREEPLRQVYYFGHAPRRSMKPGQTKSRLIVASDQLCPSVFFDIHLAFTDATGRNWIRNVVTGRYAPRSKQRRILQGRPYRVVRKKDEIAYQRRFDELSNDDLLTYDELDRHPDV